MILAIALASKPKVLLLDESTSALAVEQSVESYAHGHVNQTLWVSHDLDMKERYSSGG